MANKNQRSVKYPGLTDTYVINQIAAEFDSATSYAVGEYCNYLGQVYKCTTAHSGAWNAANFEAVYIAEEVGDVKSAQEEQAGALSGMSKPWAMTFTSGAISSTGSVNTTSTNRIRTTGAGATPAKAGDFIYIAPQYTAAVAAYNTAAPSSGSFNSWIVPFASPANGVIRIPASLAGKYIHVSIHKVGYDSDDISGDLETIGYFVKYCRSYGNDIADIAAAVSENRKPFMHPNFRPDDFVLLTDIPARPDGWWTSSGTHGSNTYVRTSLIPVYPGKRYYVTNKPSNGIQAAFFDADGNFVSTLAQGSVAQYEYQKANGYSQVTLNYVGDSSSDHIGIFYYDVPEGCYYVSHNLNSAALWCFTLSTKPIFALNTFWKFNRTLAERVMARDTTITDADYAAAAPGVDQVIPALDSAYQEYGRRKLCVIGPSTCMIDRRNPDKNGFEQYIVGWQEYLMPWYGDVVSYGYSGASWGDAYVYNNTYHSIHTMICGNESLSISGVDLSGYDDFVLMGSINGLVETGAGDWDTSTPDTDTYLGALRATIAYIYSQNDKARIWVWNLGRGAAANDKIPIIETINEELPAMCMKLGVNPVNFSSLGFNQWTRDDAAGGEQGWTYDGTHYNHTGSYMLGQYMRHILVGR